MRVLLTGAGGFIGAQVARALLARGAEVHAVVRDATRAPRLAALAKDLVIHEADLVDPAAAARVVAASKPAICVHGAWYAVPGKYLDAPENLTHVAASLDLAQRLVHAGCTRFVGLGTCFEYDTSLGVPLVESSPTKPRFLYAASKLALHDMLGHYAPLAKIGFAWCRIFYPYGPMEAPERLVPHVIDRLLGGGVADTTLGRQVRDFLHVADVGAAIAAVALSEVEGAVNVASGTRVTVRELVGTIARLCAAEDRVHFGAIPYRQGDPMHVLADVTKLASTGFTPRFDLASGLEDTLRARREELA
jgi:nucleoside-diphosphate-sugar epimerase